jgi:hypothetical protein
MCAAIICSEGVGGWVHWLSGFKHVHFSKYEARCFDELSRGSILGADIDANNKQKSTIYVLDKI